MTVKAILAEHILWDAQSSGPGVLFIKEGHIQEVLPLNHVCSIEDLKKTWHHTYPSLTIEEVKGHLLTPALVNPHTHLAMSFFRGLTHALPSTQELISDFFFLVEQHLTPEDVRAFTRMGAYEALLCGVVTVWDHYYYGLDVALGLQEVGICGVVAPTLQNTGGPFQGRWRQELEDTLALAGDKGLQKSGIFAALGPHATDTVDDALWRRISKEAQQHALPIHVHVAQSLGEWRFGGLSPVGHMEQLGLLDQDHPMLLVHGIYMTQQDLGRLNPQKHTLCWCPYSQMRFQFPAPVEQWQASGVPWVLGTDCAASNDSMNLQKELRMALGWPVVHISSSPAYQNFFYSHDPASHLEALRQSLKKTSSDQGFRVSAQELWSKITSLPGGLHPGFRAGTLAPGAKAHLCAWSLDHPSLWPGQPRGYDVYQMLTASEATLALGNVMIHGVWQGTWGDFPRGILHSPGFIQHREQADTCLSRLMYRISHHLK